MSRRSCCFLLRLHQGEPIKAHGKSDAGRWSTTKLLNQAIVAATGTNRTLGTQCLSDPLKNRSIIVVETANNRGVDPVCKPEVSQQLAQFVKVRA